MYKSIQCRVFFGFFEEKNQRFWSKISNVHGLVTTTILNTKIGEVKGKIPDISCLVTTTVLDTKIGVHENKISDVSGLVKFSQVVQCSGIML